MSLRVEQCFYDLESVMDYTGKYTSISIPYLVFDASDESAALTAVRGSASSRIANLKLDNIEIDERISETIYKIRANYEPADSDSEEDESQEPVYNFDTGGGTMHRAQSLATIARYPAAAPDFGGAIEVDNDGNVNGVDIAMPLMNFSETHYFRPSKVSTSYKKRISNLTGCVNSRSFKGYSPGEVLFLGASGARRGKRSDDYWEITFKFSVSPNRQSVNVGGIQVRNKRGWDYLWVRYADDVSADNTSLIKKPVAAYLEKVYEEADFGGLGIGR